MQYINVPPKAAALISSLRDIGYSVETAIADIIDNSVTASSKRIDVRFLWNSGNPWIAIIDDGHGLKKTELINAMRLGSLSPLEERNSNDLGRFGLGLKTASFSQCKKLTVISKRDEELSATQWDLEEVEKNKDDSQWQLKIIESNSITGGKGLFNELYSEYLSTHSGTIVIWDKIDRIGFSDNINLSEKYFNQALNDARRHIELVFHRFLLPGAGGQKINIYFNGSKLNGYDPFFSSKSTELREEIVVFNKKQISIQPYILPHHANVTSEEWNKYSGKRGYLHEQGFYVYRNKRLIISSNWFRLIPKVELTKLLRVKIDIPNSIDGDWHIDIKKSQAIPPVYIRNRLEQVISKIQIKGKSVYAKRQHNSDDSISRIWNRYEKENIIFYKINKENPFVKNILNKSSSCNIKSEIMKLFSVLENNFPNESYFNDYANHPKNINNNSVNYSDIDNLIDLFLDINPDNANYNLDYFLSIEPFSNYPDITKSVLNKKGIS